jgi:hypothetical protein
MKTSPTTKAQCSTTNNQLAATKQAISDRGKRRRCRHGARESSRTRAAGQGTARIVAGRFRRRDRLDRKIEQLPDRNSLENAYEGDIGACGVLHDAGCVQAREALPPSSDSLLTIGRTANLELADLFLEHWQAARDEGSSIPPLIRSLGPQADKYFCAAANIRFLHSSPPIWRLQKRSRVDRQNACGLRRLPASARSHRCDATSLGRLRNTGSARAVALAPSVPFGETDWGQMLLMKGDSDARDRQIHAGPRQRPALRRSAGNVGRSIDAEEPLRSRARRNSLKPKIRTQLGTPASQMGRSVALFGHPDEAKKQFARAAELECFRRRIEPN